ncbi:hypothetical protein A3F38_00580 [Candidatus Saccharibacteria bacterium RIFCSPHIGHO2_12_FULL_48_21]|nr:MAG: hypothetical protein A3F38_00580 [Candidatus Saccharibacteria bacterium RIFCSPHIGHO2_12_FULL_48_21]
MKTSTLNRLYPNAPVAIVAQIMGVLSILCDLPKSDAPLTMLGQVAVSGTPVAFLEHGLELEAKLATYLPKSVKRRHETLCAIQANDLVFNLAMSRLGDRPIPSDCGEALMILGRMVA